MTHIRFVDDLSETSNVARRMFTPIVAQQELENARLRDSNCAKEIPDMLKSFITAFAVFAAFSTVQAQNEAAAPPPTDAQIAMIAVTADTVDIDAGKMALEKTSNRAVKEFAETMVRDHTAVNVKATALAKRLGVTPQESDISKSLKSQGDKKMAELKKMTGGEFDKAYIDNEVSYHEAVLGVLDKTLIPSTRNAELKMLLESARPIFVSHLAHAKNLQASLSK
jgi:putative membrane protein